MSLGRVRSLGLAITWALRGSFDVRLGHVCRLCCRFGIRDLETLCFKSIILENTLLVYICTNFFLLTLVLKLSNTHLDSFLMRLLPITSIVLGHLVLLRAIHDRIYGTAFQTNPVLIQFSAHFYKIIAFYFLKGFPWYLKQLPGAYETNLLIKGTLPSPFTHSQYA